MDTGPKGRDMKRGWDDLDDDFDLIVVGGGIYGAWSAWDACLRGLKVLLIDKGDWASGTSSGSSKLLHGGLRYLENFEIGLVKKSLKERRVLYGIASNAVKPLEFIIPFYEDNRVPSWKVKIGLMLYDFLAGSEKFSSHRSLDTDQLNELYPFINKKDLKGSLVYGDCQMDDGRLVIDVIKSFVAKAGVAINYCRFDSWDSDKKEAKIIDGLTGEEKIVKSKVMINSAGRWAFDLQEHLPKCRFSKGVHVCLPDVGLKEAMLLMAREDGRVIFIIPWYGRTMVGTTDTDYHGDLDIIEVNEEEQRYLLDEANKVLSQDWKLSDVCGSFSGLRVMQASDSDHPSAVSREWQWVEAEDGVFASIGGKYTSARADSAVLIDQVMKYLGISAESRSDEVSLLSSAQKVESSKLLQDLERYVDKEVAYQLHFRYGENCLRIIEIFEQDSSLTSRIVEDLHFVWAELIYSAQEEMVVNLDDLCRRRLPLKVLTPFKDKLRKKIQAKLKDYQVNL